jgi:cytidylate kinase
MTHRQERKHTFIVAIDGPAASGKSTTARLVANGLGYVYIDSGAMYRAATLMLLRQGIDLNDREAVAGAVNAMSIRIEPVDDAPGRIMVNGEDVTKHLRDEEVTRSVSLVASYPGVRAVLVREQRRLADNVGVVMDGRDIGTVVFPDADVKVYMVADIGARAQRRYEDLSRSGSGLTVDDVEEELERRDSFDSTRDASPLTMAKDAIRIDTSALTIDEQVQKVLSLVEQRRAEREAMKT